MPDELTGPLTLPGQHESRGPRSPWHGGSPRVVALQAVAALALFALVGLGCGWLWHQLWSPALGTVTDGVWYTDEAGLRDDFSATALYVVVAGGAGVLLGLVCSLLLARAEVVTLLAVALGSVLAAWLMWRVGLHLSPPDPQTLAASAADDTVLPGSLRVHGRTPFVAFPGGALLALAVVFLVVQKRERSQG